MNRIDDDFRYIFYTTSLDEYIFTGHSIDQIELLLNYVKQFKGNKKAAIRIHPYTKTKHK